MGVRRATMNDVGTIVKYLKQYHEEESNLADIPFDLLSMTHSIEYYIGMPRHVCFLYERDGELLGVLAGSIEEFMFNQKRYWATDLLNVCKQGGAWLLKKFIAWAQLYKVDRIIMGVSTGNERSDMLYEAIGMKRDGGMYSMEFTSKDTA